MENCCVSAAYTSSSPSLLYPKTPLSSSSNTLKNTRPSLSIKASSSSSFKTNSINSSTLSSNWDVVGPTSAAPAWMPRFEELDTTNMLLRQRIVFLGSQVDDMSADFIISQLLFLDAEDDKKDIKLFINSPGGSVTAGMGIYDAMKLCKADISTICVGLAASMGAFLLACGTKGKRFCMPNSRVMIHQPLGQAGGNATDMSIRIREMVYHKVKVNKIISRVSGTPYEKVEADTDRDYFMNAWEAKAYGLVDEVIDDGKPGLVAPIADKTPPPKTRVWDLWKVEGSRKALKNMPSEDKLLQNGRVGGDDGHFLYQHQITNMDSSMKSDKQPPRAPLQVQHHEPPQRPIWQIIMVAAIAAGVQFGWALQLSLLTPYVQLIGVPHTWSSFIWLCGPISGMIVQPVVGYYSDRCTSRFGRRRPFIAGGAFLVAIAVFLIGYAADIGVSTGDQVGARTKPRAIGIFVVGFWILDVANNTLQGPCRALLADLAGSNSSRIRTGNAMFAFFMGVGNVLGYAAGSYTHLYRIVPFTKTDACNVYCANLKTCFFISIALLVSITVLAMSTVSEEPFVPEPVDEKSSTKQLVFFGEMLAALKELSRPMWILLLVTCLNWIAWFPFLLFDTDWMGKEVYGGKVGEGQAGQLYNRGVRAGALGLMLNSVVSGLASLGIEHLARWIGGVKRLWGGVNFLLAICLAMTVLVTKLAESSREFTTLADGTTITQPPSSGVRSGALAIFAILGAPLAVTFSVPCALASIFCNNSGAGQGLSLGVLNLAIVIPQMVVSVLSGPWDALFGGGNLPAFVVGAVAAAASGIFAFTMLPTPPPDVKVSGVGMH